MKLPWREGPAPGALLVAPALLAGMAAVAAALVAVAAALVAGAAATLALRPWGCGAAWLRPWRWRWWLVLRPWQLALRPWWLAAGAAAVGANAPPFVFATLAALAVAFGAATILEATADAAAASGAAVEECASGAPVEECGGIRISSTSARLELRSRNVEFGSGPQERVRTRPVAHSVSLAPAATVPAWAGDKYDPAPTPK